MTRTNTLTRMISDFPLDVVINVKDAPYSAVGNGVANDTTALQSAIDDGNTSGIPVYLPSGTYLISTSLVYYTGTYIYGAGKTLGTIKGNNLTVPSFKTTNQATTRYYYPVFRDFEIDNQNRANVGAIGIDLRNVSYARVRDMFFENIEMAVQLLTDNPAIGGSYYNIIEKNVISTVDFGIYEGAGCNSNAINYNKIGDSENPITIGDTSNHNQVWGNECEVFTGTGLRLGSESEFNSIFANRFENSPGPTGTGINEVSDAGWNFIGSQFFSGLSNNIVSASTTSIVLDPLHPFRIPAIATASLPAAADWKRGLVYDSTTNTLKFSNGSSWLVIATV